VKVRDLIKRLEADGWIAVKSGGTSHRKFKHPSKPGHVTLTFHRSGADIPIGTLKQILRTAGLTEVD
jgi:predicted RNA binding protein YcfA (HicA-like mRNA interferase family)